ncbi:PSP1 domain-containing protein [Williamwhitmania taraxaci]|uniref:Cell fate regulator YaaT, PSP1 superfamily (Controls sporulation, competence, biofilm development) n=1 Tax=Williamwhitmania taraxaci TaxID=1640674 RepID=A0A1G6MXN7_9BACT|nr:Cell fate regulator YaaT, PSP1 superfamily (controls sporulation, competence, biofilm development) [Williamwhitmania taraxaci]
MTKPYSSDCCRGCGYTENEIGELVSTQKEGCHKLAIHDWLKDLPETGKEFDVVEVRFKNTRKAFYRNANELNLEQGDIVAVEASPGHDIGIVSLTGELVRFQALKFGADMSAPDLKKVYRKAKVLDMQKWEEAVGLEHITMIRSRQIANRLKLNMKIGDVEYQGDRTKAIFYYIADERVDFRELIKLLAEEFKVRIEMRQIGARQEAGRIGGIGSCGRELCCSAWVTSFVSVTTNSARYQEISLNPQKLAGQCGKLKCCLNYELDNYLDAQKDFPRSIIPLETKDGTAHHVKTDILKRVMWFSFDPHTIVNITAVPVERVKEILALNKKGEKVDFLVEPESTESIAQRGSNAEPDFHNVIGQDSITRFDTNKNQQKNRKHNRPQRRPINDNRKPNN